MTQVDRDEPSNEPSGEQPLEEEEDGRHPRRSKVITSLLLWLVFGVVIGCLPVIGNGLKLSLSSGGFSMDALLAQGDLFIIAAIVSAGAIGEIIFARLPDKEKNYGIVASGFCLILCLGNTAAYAFSTVTAACEQAEENTTNASTAAAASAAAVAQRADCISSAVMAHPGLVAHMSLWLFGITAFFSAVCIAMAAGRAER